MKRGKEKLRKRLAVLLAAGLGCAGLVLSTLFFYGRHQMAKIPELSFREALEYTAAGRGDAVITVGVIQNGSAVYTVYGRDGAELPHQPHVYEIGSLTKTFTAALLAKAAEEGKAELDDPVDGYLSLPEGEYPTVAQVLTHTSGYRPYYLEAPMVSNFFMGRNSFYKIGKAAVLKNAGKAQPRKESYPFCYSNYGYALLGLVAEEVYGEDYTALVNRFAAEELGLSHTGISTGEGDLGRYWDWQAGDAYLAAGGLVSDIEDMLAYAGLLLEGEGYFSLCRESLAEIDAAPEDYQNMGIRMDEIGMAWILDRENGIIWHNGGTGDYNCYLGVCPEQGAAVVVLSNLPPDYRIPATVLGVKRMQELLQ